MRDRGMIKWKPFNSVLNSNDLYDIINSKNIKKKPIISEDVLYKIDYTIKEAYINKSKVKIDYWCDNINTIIGVIDKIDTQKKYILVNNTKIYFKDILDINKFY